MKVDWESLGKWKEILDYIYIPIDSLSSYTAVARLNFQGWEYEILN